MVERFGMSLNCISKRYFVMRIRPRLVFCCSSRRSLKSRLFDSNLSLIEFVRKKRRVSPWNPLSSMKRNACIGTFL